MIRINEKITAKEVRVIDENGENLGVFPPSEAVNKAKEKGLDLIEVGPNANPPIAKIMSFDKYRYIETKKAKQKRLQNKAQEMKAVRISARAAEHDLQVKARKVNDFLLKGSKVEIQLFLKGREKANKDWAKVKLIEFMKMIDPEHKVLLEPKYAGRGFITQIVKK
ncbi:translation initiation factor IF-3 [Candidatus Wolfebacteria bacterium]|nr:translation initiation factor IF-3 [Candidatus Wolfebacteria bacterium]